MNGIWNDSKGHLSFVKLTKKKYARDFIKNGTIKFGTPREWAEAAKEPGGRGDKYEGTLGTYTLDKLDEGRKMREWFEQYTEVFEIEQDGRVFLKSKRNINLPAFCFYMLSFDRFSNQGNWEKGSVHEVQLDSQLFKDFADDKTKAEIELLPDDEKPAIIIINDHQEFLNRMERYLVDLGVQEDDILFSEVRYTDMFADKVSGAAEYHVPLELYWKHIDYFHQSEGRVVVNTDDPKILKTLAKPVNIGSLEDIATEHDDYFLGGLKAVIVAE